MSNKAVYKQYIYLNHQPIAKLEQKQLYAIHSDHLGTPRLVTNDKKETVWKANYSPFGKATLEIHKITFNLRLPGQYEDQETGTYYNYLRDYDPETGRYITSDPIGLRGGVNTYAYVKGNPLGFIDTLGLETESSEDGSFLDDIFEQAYDQADTVLGEDFRKIATAVISGLPISFQDLSDFGDPKYSNLDVAGLGDVFKPSSETIADLVGTMVLLAAIEKIGDFIIRKPNPYTIIGGILGKAAIQQIMLYQLEKEYGPQAKELITKLNTIALAIADFDQECWEWEDVRLEIPNSYWNPFSHDELTVQETSDLAAQSIADFVLASNVNGGGIGKLKAFSKFFKKKKKKEKCDEPKTSKEHKECYKKISGFNGLNLTTAQINAMEKALGNNSKFCTKK